MKFSNYIELMISSLIPQDLLKKARLSITHNEVAVLEYSPLKILATVKSQSGYYDYKIQFKKRNEIEDFTITCDCPIKDKYCKHIAAVALYLKKNNYQITIASSEKQEASIPLLYKYETNLNELMAMATAFQYKYFEESARFSDIEFVPNEYISYRYNFRQEQYEFRMSAMAHDRIIIETNKEDFLSSDLFKSFKYYLDKRTSNKTEYITALIPQALQERKIFEQFGFQSLEESKLYISYYYNRGVVTGIKKNSHFQSVKNNHYLKLGESLDKLPQEFVIAIPDRYERKVSALSLGFMITLLESKSKSFQLSMFPVLGETDKQGHITKQIKPLTEVAPFEQPKFSELEQELIYLCSLLKNHKSVLKKNESKQELDETQQLIPHAAAFHHLMKTFIDLNKGQYPIFVGDIKSKISKLKIKQIYLHQASEASYIAVQKRERLVEINFHYFCPPTDINSGLRLHTHFVNYMFYTNDQLHYYLPKSYGECVIGTVFDDIDEQFQFALSALHNVVKSFLSPLAKLIDIKYNFPIQEIPSETSARKIYLSEVSEYLIIKLVVAYDFGEVNILESKESYLSKEENIQRFSRNRKFEEAFIEYILAQHPDLGGDEQEEYLHLPFKELFQNAWYLDFFENLQNAGIQVFGKDSIKKINIHAYKPMTLMRSTSDIDWFQIKLKVSFNKQEVSLKEIRKAILKREEYILLKDGSQGILPAEWVIKYASLLSLGELDQDTIKIRKSQFSLLSEFESDILEEDIRAEIKEKKKRFLNFEKINSVPLPNTIQAELRDYQLAGYHWLHFLHEHKWGGCLADDMGLGKTIQIISFLSSIPIENKAHLVVVPTTLLFNWEQELQKFAPHLRYLIWHGNRDKQDIHFSEYDIILTTYGVVISDIAMLREIDFNYLVLDESQAIKNPLSLRYKAVMQLKGVNKLAMTGTPIENNIYDLFAQMNFINPGLLGSLEIFKNRFITKIDRQESVTDNKYLQGLIRPFILRRTKEQVLKELPSKTEITLYCEMETEQRKVYDTFRAKIQADLLKKAAEEGMNKIGIYIIDGLLKLRQICNSPALLNTEESYTDESIKLKELMRNIKDKTGKHKVLVFSQFVKMLKLVAPALEEASIPYSYLDGQTSNRSSVVNEFIHNEEKRVFLISLKSGGFGLNLTVADYVFLIDPWWNPAVENQAIDRTHRIGQDKKVFAYRMICKDSIEEKILQIQAKKKILSEDIIHAESSFIKDLKKEDLLFLLS